jgi:hypothetical protein
MTCSAMGHLSLLAQLCLFSLVSLFFGQDGSQLFYFLYWKCTMGLNLIAYYIVLESFNSELDGM